MGGKTERLAATSITSRNSCPPLCPFYRKVDCYAENHWSAVHWKRVDAKGAYIEEFTARLKWIPDNVVWRHNVSGDLPHTDMLIDTEQLEKITAAGAHLTGFTYTHHPLNEHNVRAIRKAIHDGLTINVSTENPNQVDEIMDTHAGLPVVTILPLGTGKVTHTPGGRRIVTCPADYKDDWDCARCGDNKKRKPLCAQADRNYVIGFLPKGAQKKRVSARATNQEEA